MLLVTISLFILDYRIALVTIFLLTTPLYVPKLAEKKLQRAQMEYIQQFENHIWRITDWLDGFEVIKNYAVEQKIAQRFDVSNDETQQNNWRKKRLSNITRSLSALLSYLSHFVIIAVAAYLVLIDDFTAGSFFVAVGMIDQLSYPIISLSYLMQDLISVKPVAEQLDKSIVKPLAAESGSLLSIEQFQYASFDHVSFGFDEKSLFSDLNLCFEKQKNYLIQGASGAGKTTAMDLLLNYYPSVKGSIQINGHPSAI